MSTEKTNSRRPGPRGPNGPVKYFAMVFASVEAGNVTSVAVAKACGISVVQASARLRDLEQSGLIERVGEPQRNGPGSNGGGGAITWQVRPEHK